MQAFCTGSRLHGTLPPDRTLDASKGYSPKSIQRVFCTAHDLDQPDPITPAERARGVPDPLLLRQLVQGGAPWKILSYGCAHVLSGYGTAPEGEVQVAWFSAGSQRLMAWIFVCPALFSFHLGIHIQPITTTRVEMFGSFINIIICDPPAPRKGHRLGPRLSVCGSQTHRIPAPTILGRILNS